MRWFNISFSFLEIQETVNLSESTGLLFYEAIDQKLTFKDKTTGFIANTWKELQQKIQAKHEQDRLAKEKAEQECIAREKAELERLAKKRAEQERIAKERAEQERIAKEKAEKERIEREQARVARIQNRSQEKIRIKLEHEKRFKTNQELINQEILKVQDLMKNKNWAEAKISWLKIGLLSNQIDNTKMCQNSKNNYELCYNQQIRTTSIKYFQQKTIFESEYNFLNELERKLNKKIPLVTRVKVDKLGVKIFQDHIVGLSLPQQELTSIPSSLGMLIYLETLYLPDNSLVNIPDGIFQLVNLRELDLTQNKIEQIDEAIGNCFKLTYMNLNQNRITYLPRNLCFLKDLKRLYLQQNCLEEIPTEIAFLRSLMILDLSSNTLKDLPETIDNMVNLKELRIGGNDLHYIPESIGNLIALKKLEIQNDISLKAPINIQQAFRKLELRGCLIDK